MAFIVHHDELIAFQNELSHVEKNKKKKREREKTALVGDMFTKQICGKGIYYGNWRLRFNLLGCKYTRKCTCAKHSSYSIARAVANVPLCHRMQFKIFSRCKKVACKFSEQCSNVHSTSDHKACD